MSKESEPSKPRRKLPPPRNVRFKRLEKGGPSRHIERLFLSNPVVNKTISTAGKLFLACLIWPRFVAPYRWMLRKFDMPLAGVGKPFDGYKILQLTDLHVGKTRVGYLAAAIEQAMKEKPDLVVITGDLIDYQPAALPLLKGLLGGMRKLPHQPPDGTLAIFGNHDYHENSWRHNGPRSASRVIQKRLVQVVRDAGIHLLRNEQFVATRGPDRLVLVGIDEMWTGRADAEAAFRGLSEKDAVVCLQHNPDGIDFLKPFPWQWMLCGHSHGGQANLPVMGPLYVPMEHREYLRGFFKFPALAGQKVAERVMYVSTGLGHSTPIRMLCPPEVCLFTVRAVKK